MAIPEPTCTQSKTIPSPAPRRHIETLFPKDLNLTSVHGDKFFLPASVIFEMPRQATETTESGGKKSNTSSSGKVKKHDNHNHNTATTTAATAKTTTTTNNNKAT